MLNIRKPQKTRFAHLAEANFRSKMMDHLKSFAPKQAQAMGEQGLEDFVVKSIERARFYEVSQEDNLRVWLELSSTWGIGFANDPAFAFVEEHLSQALPELERMQAVHRDAVEFAKKTCGEQGEYLLAALQRLERLDELEESAPSTYSAEVIIDHLKQVWPERAQAVGGGTMHALAKRGSKIAEQLNCPGFPATLTAGLLVLFLGSECDTDPQYQWFWKFDTMSNTDNTMALVARSKAYLKEA